VKISSKGRYALEAMLFMASHKTDDYININQIVDTTKIPVRYLEQIFYTLRKAGLIKTLRGSKGGYRIAEPIHLITVGRIIRAVEGELAPVPCVIDLNKCSSEKIDKCITRNLWVNLTDVVDSVIDTIYLNDLVEAYKH
jgi:Rrf2 family protein